MMKRRTVKALPLREGILQVRVAAVAVAQAVAVVVILSVQREIRLILFATTVVKKAIILVSALIDQDQVPQY
jgi:hypothetical protein